MKSFQIDSSALYAITNLPLSDGFEFRGLLEDGLTVHCEVIRVPICGKFVIDFSEETTLTVDDLIGWYQYVDYE